MDTVDTVLEMPSNDNMAVVDLALNNKNGNFGPTSLSSQNIIFFLFLAYTQ